MREQPNAEALLAIARDVLKQDILPLLPSDQRYNLLMIANAMAIAARQCQQGHQPEPAPLPDAELLHFRQYRAALSN